MQVLRKNGKACIRRCGALKTGDVSVIHGIGQDFRKQCWNKMLQDLHRLAPIYKEGPDHNPHTIWRYAWDAMRLGMFVYLQSDSVYGHSPWHESNINVNNIETCTHVSKKYLDLGVEIGEKCFEWNNVLTVCVTGDGGRLPKVPHGTPMVACAFLRILGLNDYAHHSRHAGVPILISRLGDNHPDIPDYMSVVCTNLDANGSFKLWHQRYQCWCIYNYVRYDNGDWAWMHKMGTNAAGPGAEYRFPGIVRYFNGAFYGVRYKLKNLYHCLSSGIRTNEDNVEHDQLVEDNFKGYTLTKQDAADAMADQVETEWEEYLYYNTLEEDDIEPKEARNIKKDFAKKFRHGFIGRTIAAGFLSIIDICHAWWGWMNYIFCLFVMLLWIVYEWDSDDVVQVLDEMNVDYITLQVEKYMDGNKSRDPNKYLTIYSNGVILKNVINGWHGALCTAAKIADLKRIETNENNYGCVNTICVFIRVSTLMRRGFSIFLKDKFEWPADGSRPPLIQELIDCVRLATFLAYNLCSKMVCMIIFVYV